MHQARKASRQHHLATSAAAMTPLLGQQGELLAQFRELLTSPSSSPPANKLESAVGGPLAGAAGPAGPPPPPPPTEAAAPSTAMASGRRLWRRGRSSKRGRDDDEVVTNGEHHGEDEDPAAAAAAAAARPRHRLYKRRKKKEQSGGTSMLVTSSSAPDLFDGYQWRKYGQKQIEGAMYPRSYYRCTRSEEQGCAAKRTVQRNDDGGAATAVPKYTVVRVGEHTCTANHSPEAPVILETTAVAAATSCTTNNSTTPTSSSAAASCSTAAAATESPPISDNTLSGSSIATSSDYCWYVDDDYGGLFAAVHDVNDWVVPVPALAASSPPSFPRIEDFAGPIRSPVHISAADAWTIDQLLLQLVNEPAICQHL